MRSGYQPVNLTAPTSAKTSAMIPPRRGRLGTYSRANSAMTTTRKASAQTAPELAGDLLTRVLQRERAAYRHRHEDDEEQAAINAEPDADDGPRRFFQHGVERQPAKQQHTSRPLKR